MNPCELNALITSVTNVLYKTLPKEKFQVLNVLVSELSKSMFSMELLRAISEHEPHRKE